MMKDKDRLDEIEWRIDCAKQKRSGYINYQTFTWEDMAFVFDSYTRARDALKEIANTGSRPACSEEAYYDVVEEAASTLLELGEVNDPQSGEKKWA